MAVVDPDTVRRGFGAAANMTVSELERWPATEESLSVGQKSGGSGGSTAHVGQVVVGEVGLLRPQQLDDPAAEDVETSRWRYSLTNRGHDPVRKK
jgi:hypothetical protein